MVVGYGASSDCDCSLMGDSFTTVAACEETGYEFSIFMRDIMTDELLIQGEGCTTR